MSQAGGEHEPVSRRDLEALAKRIEENEARQIERVAAVKENIYLAFNAAERAIEKADRATDKRFESVNEFRAQLSDQAKLFLNANEYNVAHKAVVDKFDILNSQVVGIEATIRNRIPQTVSSSTFLLGLSSIVVVVVLSIIGGAVQIGTLQTHVTIDTAAIDRLIASDKEIIARISKGEAEIGIIALRQVNGLDRIKRLETSFDDIEKLQQRMLQQQTVNSLTLKQKPVPPAAEEKQ